MKQRVERRLGAMSFVLAAAAMLDGGASKVARSRATTATASTERDARATKGRPLKFEMNAGQWDPRVRFVAHDRGATLFVTDDAMMVGLHDAKDRSAFVSMKLVGARAGVIAGEERLGGRSNFFFGSDASKWRRNVPTFGQVRAKSWLPGVDVVWHRGNGGLEYDLALAGGADASTIELEVTGVNAMHVRDDGALALDTDAGTLLEMPPHVVQDGRTLGARYRVVGERRVAFAIDDYDRDRPLLIDPTLVYSTYLGGSSDDYVNQGIAVDSSGNVYVTGLTYSSNFPTTSGAIQTTFGGSTDVLVTKLNATASAIVYSTYMGGTGSDNGYSMIVDSSGNATIVGYANIGFPTTPGAYQTAWAGGTTDAFVAKLDATGALQYSTYFGGNSNDDGYGLAIDASGNVYISGETGGGTFPTTSGAYKTTPGGSGDGFVAKLDSTLSTLSFSTYLGGTKFDNAAGLAIDTSGNVYVSGSSSGSFPTTTGAYQTTYGGNTDAIVTKLDATGSTLLYSTYLGGTSTDACGRIAIDSSGNAYVIGATSSTNFPVTSGAFQTTGHGGDAFVTKLNASGSALVYSTYLGGASNVSRGWDIAIDGSGDALVVGGTSGAFPTTSNAIQTTYGGGSNDAFVTKVAPAGDVLVFSTYLGGSKDDQAYAIAIDSNGDDYVAGYTGGSFTTTTGAYQTTYAGGTTDIFIAKLHDSSLSISPPSATVAPKGSQSFTAKGGSGGYTWSLKTNASGGNINASTGAYTAGATGSVVDVVEVTDSSNDTATAGVTVGAGVSVAPSNPTTPPKNALTFSASGGSGTGYTYALTTNGSGGSINASSGAYTAGATANVTDVVTGTDSLGNSGTTTVTVGPGVTIAPSAPATPPKGDIAFSATGGSDAGFAWSISNNNSGAAMDGSTGAYTAGATGNVVDTVGVVDSLGNAAAVNVSVGGGLAINPATPSTPPKGAVAFSVIGGSGSGFTWLLATNASGGAIDADSGAYTAGSTPNVKDTVGVTDSLGNKANVDVTITAGVSITPTTATLATGASTTFSAAGGSGKGYAWSLATNASGGNITSGGVYTAGPTGNVTDTVQLADSLGNSATATVIVTKAVVDDAGPPPPQDASPVDAGSGAGDNGGCGCKTAGLSTTDATAPAWMAAAVVAMALRHRRSRRKRKAVFSRRPVFYVRMMGSSFASRGVLPRTLLLCALGLVVTSARVEPARRAAHAETATRVDRAVRFERNVGQFREGVRYVARTGRATLVLEDDGVEIVGKGDAPLALRLGGAHPIASEKLPTAVSYFIGNDPSQWVSGAPTFARVTYPSIRPGIDLVFHGDGDALEYDFVVAAGADVRAASLELGERATPNVGPSGDVRIATASGAYVMRPPRIYQVSTSGERIEREGRYHVDGQRVGFEVDRYDHASELVIDPILAFSSYLGGTGTENTPSIAVDSSGSIYVTGQTQSSDYPLKSAFQSGGSFLTVAVSKMKPNGTGLVYSTYFGGTASTQFPGGIAVDSSGNAYIGGMTASTDFPTKGAYQSSLKGQTDAFVTKLDSTGTALVFSTFLGGSANESGQAIAIDGSNNVLVTGYVESTDFPTKNAIQSSLSTDTDAFVTKFDSSGTSLTYSTYVGGTGNNDVGRAIAADASGNAIIVGDTNSSNFPTKNAFQSTLDGSGDLFVMKLDASGSLVYSTYLGGSFIDYSRRVAVDSSGAAYVTGSTSSTDFPLKNQQQNFVGTADGTLTKFDSTGALVYSTYLGATGSTDMHDVAVDSSGDAFVTGSTTASGFPTTSGAVQTTFGGKSDAFVTEYDSTGSSLLLSTFLGGALDDTGYAIALANGTMYVAGVTSSSDFPLKNAFQTSNNGSGDFFVSCIAPPVALSPTSVTLAPKAGKTFTATGGVGGYTFSLTTNASGASINATTGAYVAGVIGGVNDVVRVSDANGNNASANVTVTAGVTITPSSASVAPQGSTNFSAAGGSATGFVWSLAANASGGSINSSTGAYVAGTATNVVDVISVVDSLGNTAVAPVNVGVSVTVTPSSAALPPKGKLGFAATGGSGTYTWSLTTNGSGGAINTTTGAYIAGATPSTTDIVQAKDSAGNVASAVVTVGSALAIAPLSSAVAPHGSVAFTATGGAGGFTYSLTTNASAASINAGSGAYVAGAASGTDIVTVTDSVGATATASVAVGAAIAISPSTPSVAPSASLSFTAVGGSGTGYVWSIATNGSGGHIDASTGAYTAGPTGNVADVVRVVDSLANSATVSVSVGGGLAINPPSSTTLAHGTVAFVAKGGSGSYTWSLVTNGSGGSIDSSSGAYQAGGTTDTVDVVRVTDGSGAHAEAVVSVAATLGDGGADGGTQGGGSGGCGCRTATATERGEGALAFAAFAVLVALRRLRRRRASAGFVIAALTVFASAGGSGRPIAAEIPVAERMRGGGFERNVGQLDERVRYVARRRDGMLALTDDGAFLSISKHLLSLMPSRGARVPPVASRQTPTKTNYFLGSDPRQWRTNIPSFESVTYANVRDGIDLVYHTRGGALEYDFVVHPGASTDDAALDVGGARSLSLSPGGDLVVGFEDGELVEPPPSIYQVAADGSRVAVAGRYRVDGQRVGFEVGAHDEDLTLVIDPVIGYSTYLGGTSDDDAYALAIDSSGDMYLTGTTLSSDFPTKNALQSSNDGGGGDIFVAKLDSSGTSLVYATYLGGSSQDIAAAIAVDGSGAVAIAGTTSSSDFPTKNALHGSLSGLDDPFCAKLDSSGSLVFSTYFGGTSLDSASAVAFDGAGNIVFSGQTSSTNFPVTSALQASSAGSDDAFIVKLNSSGSAVTFSTYFGGSKTDALTSIAITGNGNIWLSGATNSTNFPTKTPYQGANAGANDAVVVEINGAGSSLLASTYLGGSVNDSASAIALDSKGNVIVTGSTDSTNFPLKNAFQQFNNGSTDAFIAEFNATASTLTYSSFAGGTAADYVYDVAVDSSGNAWFVGTTASVNGFPSKNPVQSSFGGAQDAFIIEVSPTGTLTFATYFGGSNLEYARAVAVDSSSNVWLAGYTNSTDFHTSGGYQGTLAGGYDAFLTAVAPSLVVTPTTTSVVPKQSLQLSGSGGMGAYSYAFKTNASGGTVTSAGLYTAGATGSVQDVVLLEDAFGNTASATITVGPGVSISPTSPTTTPKGAIAFTASGGASSNFVWSITSNQSGALINIATGAYTAGPKAGVTDTVGVVDLLGNTASTNVTVGAAIAITPAAPSVGPNANVSFSATGGSGAGYTWALVTNNSGATLSSSGSYTAGTTGNAVDVVRVTDSLANTAVTTVVVGATLVIVPSAATVPPGSTIDFSASGGSPSYTWTLAVNGSGGTINTTTGVYVAGSKASTSDVVSVVDSTGAKATAAVTVGSGLVIAPSSPSVPPLGSLAFTASGGAAPYHWSLPNDASGGSIDAVTGQYTAGAKLKTVDTVSVTDNAGASASVSVSVGAGLAINPPNPTVPAHGVITFAATGGSGVGYTWSLTTNVSGGAIGSDGTYVAGSVSGTDVVQVVDSLGTSTTTTVTVSGEIGDAGADASTDGGPSGIMLHGCQCDQAATRRDRTSWLALAGLTFAVLRRRSKRRPQRRNS